MATTHSNIPDSGALTYLTRRRCPACSHVECTAVCSACGVFKFPPHAPAIDEGRPSAAGLLVAEASVEDFRAAQSAPVQSDAYTSCLAAEIQLRRLLARNQARAAA